MEESVQREIMQAIQEILNLPPSAGDNMEVKKLIDQLDKAGEEKEQLMQKCHELELQIAMLQDEKSNISAEFEHLQAQVIFFVFQSSFHEKNIACIKNYFRSPEYRPNRMTRLPVSNITKSSRSKSNSYKKISSKWRRKKRRSRPNWK